MQKLAIKQKPTIRPELDMVDAQSTVAGAHATAEKLFEKYNGDLEKIEKEISNIKILKGTRMEGLNYREEVLWAAKWIKICKECAPVIDGTEDALNITDDGLVGEG